MLNEKWSDKCQFDVNIRKMLKSEPCFPILIISHLLFILFMCKNAICSYESNEVDVPEK